MLKGPYICEDGHRLRQRETGNFPSEISLKEVMFCDHNKYIFVLVCHQSGGGNSGRGMQHLGVGSSTKEVKRCIEN